ncbi:MAG TPA: hypothetical protein DCR43_01070 [Bacteroidales bacterium]|nr:MAG: hypothetical protein A2X11_14895 [Bacteroidetes bacterium GWE2_42_24]OFY31637.1 MAG: hypothetical protein A2X09_08640 [Bacteroidetes bacterium GWF2_43_11]HAQ64444.1 hypothetical protein [Bacteroidales bacterium]HBZ67106.1 hypothetical protein [Bacteroidales bacterium]
MLKDTSKQFDQITLTCRNLFVSKIKDYGPAWRILRIPSLTDQIYIKGERIRSLDMKEERKVNEGIDAEFIGMVNYSIIALIQLQLGVVNHPDITQTKAIELYDHHLSETKALMLRKNHDYGEAWRNMRISSITDIILMKILRIKQIEDNQGKLLASEGIDANYADIVNYAVFALIKLMLEKSEKGQTPENS